MLNKCLLELHRHGLLLKSDSVLPSVTTLVVGAPVRGSWWAHPASHEIFQTLEQLSEHPDVLLVKLIAGKDTLVDRQLWPALYAIATAGEDWQRRGLTRDAQAVYAALSAAGEVEAMGAAARQLEVRLLACAEQFHTAAGHHSKRLETWARWARRVGLEDPDIAIVEAKRTIESIFPAARLPWKRVSTI